LQDNKTKLPAKWLTRAEIANHFQVSKDAVDSYAKKHSLKSRIEKINYACTGAIKTQITLFTRLCRLATTAVFKFRLLEAIKFP
jgi:hypothetical protein